MKINVNGRDLEISPGPISYEKIVELAGMTGTPSMTFRMKTKIGERTFRDEGILSPGEVLTGIKEGAHFTVCHTNKA